MNKLEQLNKIILKEAPLSSYVKSIASKAVNPAAYARGAGSLIRGAGNVAGTFTTSTKSTAGTLGAAGNVATGIGGALSRTGQWLKDPGYSKKEKPQQTKQQQQQKFQQLPGDLSKTKTSFIVNNQQIQAKYIGDLKTGYPVFRIKGISWAQSVVVEPQQKDKVNIYMYPDKKPNIKKPPAMMRPGTINFSGVENKLVITTK
jgi:hypothetical protein